ncbi:MAG TPA: UvrD-helicase domain-containing protein [Candidatus Blautia excrementipullorum]|nr:UvrD-helicase domain-containing protein [Candidatus Blautia excrementipullorum]
MKYIADLHIHSRYSRATSREGTPEHLDLWARKKGISIVGTGDFTHPAWREELTEKLAPAEDGLYRLKEEYVLDESRRFCRDAPRFIVSGEISSIYKKNGKTRKVHNVILLPGLEEAERLSKKLETIGNIHSDGRPILGLDCRELLEIMLDICPEGILIPAHIWTPHFSLFGAFSGFDTAEECFEDLTPYIHAVETGLSSDPPMNWRWSALDRFHLISNSDAHSPSKLGREANLFDIDLSYEGVSKAVQQGEGLEGTIEFFPEEGKYHYDGHRKCHICLSPAQAEQYQGKCPVCGRKLTIGVDHRIVQLADRPEGIRGKNGRPFESLVPLPEVIAASVGKSASSKKVQEQYEAMLDRLGSEFEILRKVPEEDIRRAFGYMTAEGIRRLRAGEVKRNPGFDGEYGTIRLFDPDEIANPWGQMSFFQEMGIAEDTVTGKGCPEETLQNKAEKNRAESAGAENSVKENRQSQDRIRKEAGEDGGNAENTVQEELNEKQRQAAEAFDRAVAVIAGPGTGKTKTLTARIRYLLETRKVKASEITAVTFTNLAAKEMKERLAAVLGGGRNISRLHIGTFHAICMEILEKTGRTVYIAQEADKREWAEAVCREYGLSVSSGKFLQAVSVWKTGDGDTECEIPDEALKAYRQLMRGSGRYDFDDLLLETLSLFENEEPLPEELKKRFRYVLVDEFQDISPLQYRLVAAWNRNGRELFAIGDPDQSIYGFRGADAGCFSRMKGDFPDMKVITLTENYRSTGKVLQEALSVICHNGGYQRTLHSHLGEGIPVRIVEASSKMGEAVFAAKEITRLIGGIDMLDVEGQTREREGGKTRSFRDIAVLYRTHYQARLLEKTLSQEGIPYVVNGREDFLETPLVRGTIRFFLSLIHPEDEACRAEALKMLWGSLDPEIARGIYMQEAEKFGPKWEKTAPKKLLDEWAGDLNQAEDENLKNLIGMAVLYKKMPEFLEELLLGEEGDLKRCNGRTLSADAVQLMTLHGSKGLEFPAVILYGAGKGELPLENGKYPSDMEEERRLFYVGMTRAKEELIITYTKDPSPFLAELDEKSVKRERAGREKNAETGVQMSLFDFLS